jgi:Ca2+-binding EF-hand superfamily protein
MTAFGFVGELMAARTNCSAAQRQFHREVRRISLQQFVDSLPSPNALWAELVHVAGTPNGDIDAATIDFNSYERACAKLSSDYGEDHPVLSPTAFTRAAAGAEHAPLVALFSYLAKKVLMLKLRCRLELCSSTSSAADVVRSGTSGLSEFGYVMPRLTQDDVESFMAGILPHISLARDCPPWMVPYYLAHASTRIMLSLDDKRSRTVPVDRFMTSEVLGELLTLYDVEPAETVPAFPVGAAVEVPEEVIDAARKGAPIPDPSSIDPNARMANGIVVAHQGYGDTLESLYTVAIGAEQASVVVPRCALYFSSVTEEFRKSMGLYMEMHDKGELNWFSILSAMNVYVHFCSLDADCDGLLNEEELMRFNRNSLTDLAVQRILQEHVTGNDSRFMDFKQFLELSHALEFPSLKASLRYLWRVADAHGTGTFIDMHVLRTFCKRIAERLTDDHLMAITADSMLSEIVDMIDPRDTDRVTFQDLEACGHGGVILTLLLDYRSFFNYDSREQQLASRDP